MNRRNLIAGLTALSLSPVGVALAPASPAAAQELSQLTLVEAIAIAERNAPTVRAAEFGLESAEARVTEITGGAFPQLSLSTSAFSFNMLGTGSGGAGLGMMGMGGMGGLGGMSGMGGLGMMGGLGGLGMMGLGGGGNTTTQVQLSANQVLFDAFQTQDGLKIADSTRDLARVEILSARRRAQFDAANAYLGVLRAESLLEVSRVALEQARAHVEQAQLRERSGVGTRFEVLQAQTQLANTQGQFSQASNRVELARLSLGTALGVSAMNARLDSALTLPRAAVSTAVYEAAIANRLEVQQIDLKREMDETTVTLRSRAYLPTVAGIGMLTYQPGSMSYYLLGASMNWTLVNGGKTKAQIAQAEAEVAKDLAQLESVRRQVALDIQNALSARTEAIDRVAIAQQGVAAAAEGYRLAQVRFQAGMGTGLEVIDAQTSLAQAQSNLVQAQYDVQAAELRVTQALGLELQTVLAKKGSES